MNRELTLRSAHLLSHSPMITACLAPESFEQELRDELTSLFPTLELEQRDRLFVFNLALVLETAAEFEVREKLERLAWSQNTWFDCKQIEFTSISHAAKQLRAFAPFWSLYSTAFHRRAQLIQDQLPKLKSSPLDFLAPLPSRKLASFTLLNETTLLVSLECSSRLPNGQVVFNEDKLAPSRAYMKLWELFTVEEVKPQANEKCLDLGAAPGGWTYVLNQLGCEVIAVDRAELDPMFDKQKRITTLKRNAFTLTHEDTGPIDWLFSDLICYPKDLLELVQRWLASGKCRNFVCTLKFRGPTDHETARAFALIPGSHLKHLSVNKHELTWWLVRPPAPGEEISANPQPS